VQNGRPRGGRGKSTACRNEGCVLGASASREELLYFLPEVLEGRIQRSLSGLHHHRPPWSKSAKAQTDRLAQPAPDSIPHHAAAQRFRHREANLRPGLPVHFQAYGREVRARRSEALIVDLAELGPLSETGVLGPGTVPLRAFDRITWRYEQPFRS